MPGTAGGALLLYGAAVVLLLSWAAWRDVIARTIPDRISIALIVVGLLFRSLQGWSEVGSSLCVAAILFLVLLPLCGRGLMGGADLKLLTALAAGMAPLASLYLILWVSVIGGGMAASYLLLGWLFRRLTQPSFVRSAPLLRRIAVVELWRIRRRAPLPYGVAIAIGAVFTVIAQKGV